MFLQKKVLIFIALISIICISATYVIANLTLRNQFTELENSIALRNTERINNILDSTVQQLELVSADYAGWDDTYAYMENKNKAYLETNIINESFTNTKINYMLLIDDKNQLVYGKGYNFNEQMPLELPADISPLLAIANKIQGQESTSEGISGLITINEQPMLIAAYPIVTSEKEGPIAGTFIMGRLFNDSQKNELQTIANVDVRFDTPDHKIPSSTETRVTPINKDLLQGHTTIDDVNGNPVLKVTVNMDREITKQLDRAVGYILAALVFFGLGSVLVALGFVQAALLQPLNRLVSDIKRITETGKFSLRVQETDKNEIGIVAFEVNKMISSLEQTSRSLINVNKELKIQRDSIEQQIDVRTHEVKEEQARLLASINAFPDAYIITDPKGKVLVTNNALNKIFDTTYPTWTLDQLKESFKGYFDIERNLQISLAEKKSLVMSGLSYKKKFLKVYIAPIKLSGNEDIIGLVILIGDITESVLTERSKDEFLSIASHELRTPLTAIKGNSELLKAYFGTKSENKDFQEMINDIYKASTSLISIVNDFLTTSRLEQGRLDLHPENFPIDTLVRETVEKYQQSAHQKDIKLEVSNITREGLQVTADKQRLEEIIINLIGNAIKYTDKGSIKIIIDNADRNAKVSVIDTGRGIPQKQHGLLFKKFQQASNNIFTRDVTQGTGLGLYISKLLIESMGGEIYLEHSTENKGSIFTFTIPLAS